LPFSVDEVGRKDGCFEFETLDWVDWFNTPRLLPPLIPPPKRAKRQMAAEPKKKKMMPVILIGSAGLVETVVAVTTAHKLDLILAIGLFAGAFSMWLQIRKKA
jgi:hypothetical protein